MTISLYTIVDFSYLKEGGIEGRHRYTWQTAFWGNGVRGVRILGERTAIGGVGGGGLYHAHNVSDMGPCDSWVFLFHSKGQTELKQTTIIVCKKIFKFLIFRNKMLKLINISARAIHHFQLPQSPLYNPFETFYGPD